MAAVKRVMVGSAGTSFVARLETILYSGRSVSTSKLHILFAINLQSWRPYPLQELHLDSLLPCMLKKLYQWPNVPLSATGFPEAQPLSTSWKMHKKMFDMYQVVLICTTRSTGTPLRKTTL